MTFAEVLDIAEFAAGFELHLNAAVKGPPIPEKEEPKKSRFVIGRGNTGHPRLDPDGIPIKSIESIESIDSIETFTKQDLEEHEEENAQQPQ